MPHRYKLTLSYDGTQYSGWQIQPNAPTIQEHVQNAAKKLLKKNTPIIAAGRTDAGVHALKQVAHFDHESSVDENIFLKGTNGILPKDIRILNIEPVSRNFHARYGAIKKTYHYYLSGNPFQNPFRRLYSHHIRHKIDIALMRKAAAFLIGEHDFSSFANEAYAGSAAKNPIRNIHRIDIIEENDNFVRLEFEANSFLYKMVRNITGTLLEIASGKRPISDMEKILQAKDRRKAGKAAAPNGLFMVSVDYPEQQKDSLDFRNER